MNPVLNGAGSPESNTNGFLPEGFLKARFSSHVFPLCLTSPTPALLHQESETLAARASPGRLGTPTPPGCRTAHVPKAGWPALSPATCQALQPLQLLPPPRCVARRFTARDSPTERTPPNGFRCIYRAAPPPSPPVHFRTFSSPEKNPELLLITPFLCPPPHPPTATAIHRPSRSRGLPSWTLVQTVTSVCPFISSTSY